LIAHRWFVINKFPFLFRLFPLIFFYFLISLTN